MKTAILSYRFIGNQNCCFIFETAANIESFPEIPKSALTVSVLHLLRYDGIDDGHGRDIHYVTDRTFYIRKVYRLVQSHLDRSYHLGITHGLDKFVG